MKIEDVKIIYECIHGSRAYGLNTPESDTDLKGIFVGPNSIYLGFLTRCEQFEFKNPDDRVIYNITKFFKLAADCNPNIIEVLFCDESDIVTLTESGKLIRDNAHLFLSKKARYTFLGYAFAQLKRIKTHRHWLLNPPDHQPTRGEFGLPERRLISTDRQGAFLYVVANILDSTIEEAKLSVETREELHAANWMGLCQSSIPSDEKVWSEIAELTGASGEFVEVMMREKSYTNALNNWKSYTNWKETRNPKRAALEARSGYDTKHAMHLVRLVKMGEEILSGKGVIVKRPDRKELLAIRNGAWSFEQIEEWCVDMDKRMDELYKASPLPKSPNRSKLDELCCEIVARNMS